MTSTNKTLQLTSLALALLAVPASHASIVQLNASNDNQAFFDSNISTTDLIEGGSATLSGSVIASGTPNFPASGANDGTANFVAGLTYWGSDGTYTSQTLTFNLAGSVGGYDISTVNSIFGWPDSRSRFTGQQWKLSVTTVANPAFTQIYAVNYQAFTGSESAAGSTQVTLSDSGGFIATGVTALRFEFFPYAMPGDFGYSGEIGIIHELDVIGSITPVPEPSTMCLMSLGGGALLLFWKRRAPGSSR